jgi:hypothetical protein
MDARRGSALKVMGELRVEVIPKSYDDVEMGELRLLLAACCANGLDPLRIMELGREYGP